MITDETFYNFGEDGFFTILTYIPNNINKEISPLDIRNGFYTIWGNMTFKPLKKGSLYYIGMDNQPNGGLSGSKLYFGGKTMNGVDVMTTQLLSSDTDIFFFNNRNSSSERNTKVSFLGGNVTNTILQLKAPYIESSSIDMNGRNYITFNIINDSGFSDSTISEGGVINIKSTKGTVSINDMIFPKVSELSSFNNKFLKVENGVIVPGDASGGGTNPAAPDIEDIMYTNNTPVPLDFGGIKAGQTFTDVSIKDMLDMLIYPYVSPNISLSVAYTPAFSNTPSSLQDGIYVEYGNKQTVVYSYTISKRTNPITGYTAILNNTAITTPAFQPADNISGSQDFTTLLPTNAVANNVLKMRVYDVDAQNPGRYIDKPFNINVILPYIVGVSNVASDNINTIRGLINSPNTTTRFNFYLNNNTETVFPVNTIVNGNQSNKCIYIMVDKNYETPDMEIQYYVNGYQTASTFKKVTGNLQLQRWGNLTATYNIYVYTYDGITPNVTNINTNFRVIYQ